MGSLQDQLLKAKLVSKKKYVKTKQKQRMKQKELGAEKLREEKQRKKQEYERKLEEQRKRSQELEEKKKRVETESDYKRRIQETVRSGEILKGARGKERFYITAQSGKIVLTSISENLASKLKRGEAAFVEYEENKKRKFVPVTASAARKLLDLNKETVRFFIQI